MSALNFSAANLAVVAYCEVDFEVGASTRCNSGVSTTMLSIGVYQVTLPTTLSQPNVSDVIVVQPLRTPGIEGTQGRWGRDIVVDDSDLRNKVIYIWRSSTGIAPGPSPTPIQLNFKFLLLRTTVQAPYNLPP